MVRHAPIHRRSGHSDIAICCGRNVRGSSPSTSVVPLSNQVTTLNHKRFKGFKMFSDGHLECSKTWSLVIIGTWSRRRSFRCYGRRILTRSNQGLCRDNQTRAEGTAHPGQNQSSIGMQCTLSACDGSTTTDVLSTSPNSHGSCWIGTNLSFLRNQRRISTRLARTW